MSGTKTHRSDAEDAEKSRSPRRRGDAEKAVAVAE